MKKVSYAWIDFLKGLSIFAVVFDHLYGLVYKNESLHLLTEFSVTTFIFLAGITSVISIDRNKLPLWAYQKRRAKAILVPYAVATAIYVIVNLQYTFDLRIYWNSLLSFNASPPFYFIVFFLELILIAPYMYKLINNTKIWVHLLCLVLMYIVSKYLTHNTLVGDIYGGGGRILGGSYLFVFFLGMLFYTHYKRFESTSPKAWLLTIGIIFSFVATYLLCLAGWLNLGWTNPPNKYTIIYSLIIVIWGYSLFGLLQKSKLGKIVGSIVTTLGRYSLYIFLYHLLAIFYITKILNYSMIKYGLTSSILILVFALTTPLLIGYLTKSRTKLINSEQFKKWFLKRR